jgi:hypothetical protein
MLDNQIFILKLVTLNPLRTIDNYARVNNEKRLIGLTGSFDLTLIPVSWWIVACALLCRGIDPHASKKQIKM